MDLRSGKVEEDMKVRVWKKGLVNLIGWKVIMRKKWFKEIRRKIIKKEKDKIRIIEKSGNVIIGEEKSEDNRDVNEVNKIRKID